MKRLLPYLIGILVGGVIVFAIMSRQVAQTSPIAVSKPDTSLSEQKLSKEVAISKPDTDTPEEKQVKEDAKPEPEEKTSSVSQSKPPNSKQPLPDWLEPVLSLNTGEINERNPAYGGTNMFRLAIKCTGYEPREDGIDILFAIHYSNKTIQRTNTGMFRGMEPDIQFYAELFAVVLKIHNIDRTIGIQSLPARQEGQKPSPVLQGESVAARCHIETALLNALKAELHTDEDYIKFGICYNTIPRFFCFANMELHSAAARDPEMKLIYSRWRVARDKMRDVQVVADAILNRQNVAKPITLKAELLTLISDIGSGERIITCKMKLEACRVDLKSILTEIKCPPDLTATVSTTISSIDDYNVKLDSESKISYSEICEYHKSLLALAPEALNSVDVIAQIATMMNESFAAQPTMWDLPVIRGAYEDWWCRAIHHLFLGEEHFGLYNSPSEEKQRMAALRSLTTPQLQNILQSMAALAPLELDRKQWKSIIGDARDFIENTLGDREIAELPAESVGASNPWKITQRLDFSKDARSHHMEIVSKLNKMQTTPLNIVAIKGIIEIDQRTYPKYWERVGYGENTNAGLDLSRYIYGGIQARTFNSYLKSDRGRALCNVAGVYELQKLSPAFVKSLLSITEDEVQGMSALLNGSVIDESTFFIRHEYSQYKRDPIFWPKVWEEAMTVVKSRSTSKAETKEKVQTDENVGSAEQQSVLKQLEMRQLNGVQKAEYSALGDVLTGLRILGSDKRALDSEQSKDAHILPHQAGSDAAHEHANSQGLLRIANPGNTAGGAIPYECRWKNYDGTWANWKTIQHPDHKFMSFWMPGGVLFDIKFSTPNGGEKHYSLEVNQVQVHEGQNPTEKDACNYHFEWRGKDNLDLLKGPLPNEPKDAAQPTHEPDKTGRQLPTTPTLQSINEKDLHGVWHRNAGKVTWTFQNGGILHVSTGKEIATASWAYNEDKSLVSVEHGGHHLVFTVIRTANGLRFQNGRDGNNEIPQTFEKTGQDNTQETKKSNDADEQYKRGLRYLNGNGVQRDYVEAVRLFKLSAEQGNANGQNNLGFLYMNGQGVEKNDVEAVRLFRLSAEQGHSDGQCNLGVHYLDGQGVEKNEVEAVRLIRLSAEQGNPNGQYNLGVLYRDGRGVEKDEVEAARLFKLSAEQGNPNGQSGLGGLYLHGQGVEKDEVEAARLFKLSAEQGNIIGQNGLGFLYSNGQGVEKNDVEAVRLFRLSAEQGDLDAMNNLGFMIAKGRGVTIDRAEGLKWIRKAASQGNENALQSLKEIEEEK